MYDSYEDQAWRTDEQLIDDALKRVFGKPPKMDGKFDALLDKLNESSGRQDDNTDT